MFSPTQRKGQRLGNSLYWHYASKEQPALAGKHLKLSAERGFPCALAEISDWYIFGKAEYNIKISISDAKRARERAAGCGHAKARFDLSRHYIEKKHGGYCRKGKADVQKAIQIMELAGEEGYGESYARLGDIFQYGNYGKEQHMSIAMNYYQMGFKKNKKNVDSWYGMGCCFSTLEQIKEDSIEDRTKAFNGALTCFQTAAMQDDVKSQEKASWMLIKCSPGHPEYFTKGVCWAQIALNNGSEWAKTYLQNKKAENDWSSICFNCYAVAKGGESRFHKCSKCQIAHYCSKQCQNEHWHKFHNKVCGGNKTCQKNSHDFKDLLHEVNTMNANRQRIKYI